MDNLDDLSTDQLLTLLFILDPIAALDLITICTMYNAGASVTAEDTAYLKEMGISL